MYLDEERRVDLRLLAHRQETTISSLLRHALEETFEDDLDAIRGERRLEEHLRDPSGSISLDEYVKERRNALSDGTDKKSRKQTKP